MVGGQHASEEVLAAIEKDLGLDLPLHKQYLLYLNDLSPFSIHNDTNEDSYIYLNDDKYSYSKLFSVGANRVLVMKTPYLRRSYQTKRKVSEIISSSMPGTVVLALTAIIIATIIGIFMGVISAINKGSFFDNFSLIVSVLGMSGPSFYMAMIISWIGGYLWYAETLIPMVPVFFLLGGLVLGIALNKLKNKNHLGGFSWGYMIEMMLKSLGIGLGVWLLGITLNGFFETTIIPAVDWHFSLPGTGLNTTGSLYTFDDYGDGEYLDLRNLILPALTLGIRPLAIIVQLTRSSLLDVLSQDYIRTATAKGLGYYKVIVKHALKNALNPVITAISGWFASLLAGAVFIEIVFNWKGLGLEVYNSLIKEDFPVVIGTALIIATIFVLINMFVDIIYGVLDPRIRVK